MLLDMSMLLIYYIIIYINWLLILKLKNEKNKIEKRI